MPGHIKKSDGPDPDPSPWLIVSPELKVKLKAKPYDAKKSCWVPNKATHGYDEGLIESTEGDKVTVMILESKEVIICNVCKMIKNIRLVNNNDRFRNTKLVKIYENKKYSFLLKWYLKWKNCQDTSNQYFI